MHSTNISLMNIHRRSEPKHFQSRIGDGKSVCIYLLLMNNVALFFLLCRTFLYSRDNFYVNDSQVRLTKVRKQWHVQLNARRIHKVKVQFIYKLHGRCNRYYSQGNLLALEEVFAVSANLTENIKVEFSAHCSGYWSRNQTGIWEFSGDNPSSTFKTEVSYLPSGVQWFSKRNICGHANELSQVTTPCLLMQPEPNLQSRIARWIESIAEEYPVFAWKLQGTTGGSGVKLLSRSKVRDSTQEFNRSTGGLLQGYVHNPITYWGYKVDLRLYLAVTSLNPLRLYVSRTGMFRVAYPGAIYNISDLSDLSAHVTNCHFRSRSKHYVASGCHGESLSTLGTLTSFRNTIIPANNLTVSIVWGSIHRKLYSALLSLQGMLLASNNPDTSFLLWADVIVNKHGEAYIMELDPNRMVFKTNSSCSGSDPVVSKENYASVLGGVQIVEFKKLWHKLSYSKGDNVDLLKLEAKIAQLVDYDQVNVE